MFGACLADLKGRYLESAHKIYIILLFPFGGFSPPPPPYVVGLDHRARKLRRGGPVGPLPLHIIGNHRVIRLGTERLSWNFPTRMELGKKLNFSRLDGWFCRRFHSLASGDAQVSGN